MIKSNVRRQWLEFKMAKHKIQLVASFGASNFFELFLGEVLRVESELTLFSRAPGMPGNDARYGFLGGDRLNGLAPHPANDTRYGTQFKRKAA